jgi:iron(III) transport system substrate-binding protein
VALAAPLVSLGATASRADEINLYSTREAALVEPVIAAFTAATGIKVNLTVIPDSLVPRMQAEGDASPADVLMTIGLDKTAQFAAAGLTQAINSPALDAAIPAPLRDRGRQWVGLSVRPRVVVASIDAAPEAIRYEDLADPRWRGKLCMRSALHQNNVALVAAFLLHNGEAATETWLRGLKANLAQPADGKDNDVIRNIAQGSCAIGIANTVALAQLRDGREGAASTGYANKVKAVPSSFRNHGAHVNLTGAALAIHAPHRGAALRFLEYLVTPAAQNLYAAAELEYPVNRHAEAAALVAAIGAFDIDTLPVDQIAAHQKAAVALIRKAGFES